MQFDVLILHAKEMIVIPIYAASRLIVADADSWFSSLSPEQQKEYISLHPGSKYAAGGGSKSKDESKDTSHGKPEAKPSHSLKDVHDFAVSDAAKPHSKERRSFGKFLKDHAKGIIKNLKNEVKEAGVAGHSVSKLLRGKKLSDDEKHALKATTVRLAIVCGSLALSGGLATALGEGVKHVAQEIAADFLNHGLISATEKTLMHSSILTTATDDDGLDMLASKFADYMATSPNVQKILASAK